MTKSLGDIEFEVIDWWYKPNDQGELFTAIKFMT